MAQQKAVSGSAYKNNGGTFLNATATRGNTVTATFGFTKYAFSGRRGNTIKLDVYGTTVSAGGVFNRYSRYMMSVAYMSHFLGSTITYLGAYPILIPVRTYARINRKESFRTLRRITAGWNYVTGAQLTAPTAATDTMESIDNSSTVDTAAYPTRAVPGEFAYQYGAASPKRTTYRAKTG